MMGCSVRRTDGVLLFMPASPLAAATSLDPAGVTMPLFGSTHPFGLGFGLDLFAVDPIGSELFARLLPLVYGACFLALLWQAFRVMGRGYAAVPRPGDQSRASSGDRTGRLTIHPELLDADGQLTRDDLLTVRFGGDPEQPASPNDPS